MSTALRAPRTIAPSRTSRISTVSWASISACLIRWVPTPKLTDSSRFRVVGGKTSYEVTVMLDLVNAATFAQLDDDARLDKRAAQGIVDARPIADMDALADAYYVGHSAMELLKAWLPTWLDQQGVTLEVYDNVAFTHQEAASALAAANNADRDMFESIGIRGWQQNLLMEGRWFSSLETVADTTGIGPLTMQRLRDLGVAGWPNAEPWTMSGADAIEITQDVASEVGQPEWADEMWDAIGDDASGDPSFAQTTTDAIASHVVERTGAFATARIGKTFSSRKAALDLCRAYAQGLESAALIDYPHGALSFVPALDTEAKIERGRQAFLYYWEHTVVHSELFYIWHEHNPNGIPTWADLEDEVANDLYNGNFPYATEELPDDSTATALYGDVYYWFHEIHIDDLGKATFVFVEFD